MLSISELKLAAKTKLAASGLTKQHMDTLKMSVLMPPQTKGKVPTAAAVGSLYIPYFCPLGKPTDFFRLRYLETAPGFASAVAKPQKYVQAKGSLNDVYLPPLLAKPWQNILLDPTQQVFITEGELKAACACSLGLPTIGLGGVEMWRSAKRQLPLLPTLADAKWAGRDVVIVYDSDLATNPNVLRAQNQLCAELTRHGARPRIAVLPAEPGVKVGLDDYLVAKGADMFLAEVLGTALPSAEAQALWRMNEEVVYIKDPGMVVVRDTSQCLSPAAFEAHAYANRDYLETRTNAQGVVSTKRKQVAPAWIMWPHRFELAGFTYEPGKPHVTESRRWNSWNGWGVQPKAGNIEQWQKLMDFVFKENKPARQWFERWLAYPLQHPGAKLFTAAAIWGRVHGTGKTLIGHTMLRIYGKNGQEIKDKDLKNGFNGWAQNKQFIVGDEVTGSDKRSESDALKSMITQQQLKINIKYVPEYVVPDCVNYFFTSNHPDAFFLEDTDRRYFIHELVGEPADRDFYNKYDAWYHTDEGAAALFHHLLSLPLGDWNPKAGALETDSKVAMILDSKSDLGSWVVQLKEDPNRTLFALGQRASTGCDLFTNAQLRQAYDPESATKVSANGVGRELKRAGLPQVNGSKPVSTEGGLARLYAVRNVEHWVRASPAECAAHWNKHFGSKAGKF